MSRCDALTKRWTRNTADEHAVSQGCRFDEARADHVLEFIEGNLRLYEGEYAGQPVRLMDWQVDVLSRIFGWVRHSKSWDREVRRFRKASLWVPKKNGKSPLAAMVGLYLLCADGEMGQKVFSAAKDGKQAQIVHMHARQMVLQSELLAAECVINKSTGRITHEPTVSFYDILAGDNIEGQEGLNGSIIIDELHVVDDRLAKRLEYMGASRSEPLQFYVSTAGTNVDGFGKQIQDKGREVNAGNRIDDYFFCEIFEAPRGCTDEECRTPEVWKAANPSWGYIIKEEEIRHSCEQASQGSLADWITWKMYRLNIWSAAANPWLKKEDWDQCYEKFTADDLAGRECWLGLDLSKTRDMTAVVLVFPDEDETFYQLPFFFMPEDEARKRSHLAEYLTWARDGQLILTGGNVLDYAVVEKHIEQLAETYSIQKIVYDPTFAEELTQRLQDNIGVERVVFKQSLLDFADATEIYDRLISSHRLKHNGHKVLEWQAGHATVKEIDGKKKPVKPKRDDHRKIDGIIAGIMGTAVASRDLQESRSVYEDRGILTL